MTKEISLLPHQYDFVSSDQKNTMLVAGYGSGKSHAGTIKTIFKKFQYPTKKVGYYLPTYGLIRDIAFDKFPMILEEMGISYKLNKSDKEIAIENAGIIIFRSMDTPESIVGYETAYTLIDEADILPMGKMDTVYKKILGRNRAVDDAIVDAVCTPEGFKWLYQQSKSGHFNVIKARTYDNKHLPKGYIEQLEAQYPPNLLQAYLNGEFINLTSGQVYSYYDRDKHRTSLEPKDDTVLHVGQDFNVGGCVSTVHIIKDNSAYLVDEIVSDDTEGIIRNLKNNYPEHKITIYPDASGDSRKTNASTTDIELLRKAGFSVDVPRKNGAVKDRVNSVNVLFNQGRYYVNDARCPKSAEALEQQAYDKNGEPEKFPGGGTIDDVNDSLSYFIVRRFPIVSYARIKGGFNT